MSHFSLGVITSEKPEEHDLEVKLEPYGQHISVRSVTPKKQVIENARRWREDYKESNMYKDFMKDPDEYRENASDGHIEFLEETFPEMLKMTDEELYQYEIRYEEKDNITRDGGVVSYYNPNTKWDWWVTGGRWDSSIPTKSGELVNTAKISEIEFKPDAETVEEYSKIWDIIVNEIDGETGMIFPPTKEFLLETYDSKEDYVKASGEFNTYAILLPCGEWVEPGRMGMFGISDENPKSKQNYIQERRDIMDEYKDYYLTIVDCHI